MADEAKTAAPVESPVEFLKDEPAGRDLNKDLKFGYVVGLAQDGNFLFQIVGTDKGLVELMGIHKYAELAIQSILDRELMIGDRVSAEILNAVQQLGAKVEMLMRVTKKPDNKIG